MKRFGWISGLCLSLAFGVASACSPDADGGDTQTNWLKTCTSSAECGNLECLCGYCAKACDTLSLDCTGTPVATDCHDSASAAVAALCGTATPASAICLASCTADVECGGGQRCVGGACVPGSSAGPDGGSGGEVTAFCERWVEALCAYTERCGCGSEAGAACRTQYAATCGADGIFAPLEAAVADGTLIYDAAAADALLARFEAPDPLCVEEPFRNMRLSSDELYSWAGVFTGTRAIGSPCELPVGYRGGISDCVEGAACAPLDPTSPGSGTCIALVGLGEPCDGSGDHNLTAATPRLCFDARPPDADGEYESAFDSLTCAPDAPGSTTLVCARDLESGAPCHDHEGCASGVCGSGPEGMRFCAEPLPDGSPCVSPSECQSGACSASSCTAPAADGAACNFDSECASGLCRQSAAQPGVCGPKIDLAVGEACTADFECATRTCRMGTCWADICGDYLSP